MIVMVVKGIVRGGAIWLEGPLPQLEGRQVRAEIEPVDEVEAQPRARELQQAWDDWVAHGPQGPLEGGEAEDAGWP
ncbi:MAG TPA: hypothetical protein VGQ83_11640 [Polyangia bacterium]